MKINRKFIVNPNPVVLVLMIRLSPCPQSQRLNAVVVSNSDEKRREEVFYLKSEYLIGTEKQTRSNYNDNVGPQ
jgi:hypothetical protein